MHESLKNIFQQQYLILLPLLSNTNLISCSALSKNPKERNWEASDMWSFAILLWELATREVPFADLSPMECGMKVCFEIKPHFSIMSAMLLLISENLVSLVIKNSR